MTFGKPGKRRARFALVALAAGTVVLAGSLSATGASAATAGTSTTVITHQKAPASSHVIFPSYYVTPAGKRLSVAQAGADAATPAAAAASLPVYYIPSGDSGELSGIHACEELGSHDGTDGVECADLWAEGASGYVYVSPFGEGYCQDSSGYPQCANITFKFLVADAVSTGSARVAVSDDGYCGHSHGACFSGGRNYFLGDSAIGTDACHTEAGDGNEFWTVVLSGTTIELPGDVNVASTSNFASPHAIICP